MLIICVNSFSQRKSSDVVHDTKHMYMSKPAAKSQRYDSKLNAGRPFFNSARAELCL